MARKDEIYAKPIVNCGDVIDVDGEHWFVGGLFAEDDPNVASHILATHPKRASVVVPITKTMQVVTKSRAAVEPIHPKLRGCQRCGISLSNFDARVKICPACEKRMAHINKPLGDF